MRILALRGKNLASLDAFDIAFDSGPLGGAGLFAITGRTGAGKSTLLDAMCLALYASMPRLEGRESVTIGRADEPEANRLHAADPRAILRRGCGEGYAEVDFRASDGQAYRARWTVRRARGRADGRPQDYEIALTRLADGAMLGGKRTETLARIAALVGLSFEQFRRAVLLAQGDFAAFLKARQSERAELLERITGTEIYGELSRAAFERAKLEEGRLTALEAELAGDLPLSDEVAAETRQQLGAAAAQGDSLAGSVREIEAALAWHLSLARLIAVRDAARATLDEATMHAAAARARREQLAQIESAVPLALPLQQTDAAAARQAAAQLAVDGATQARQRTQQARDAAQEAESATAQARQQAVAALDAAQDELAAARLLDHQLGEAEQAWHAAREQAAKADAQLQAGITGRQRLADEQTGLLAEQTQCCTGLDQTARWAPLSAEWGRWQGELRRLIAASADGRRLQADIATQEQRLASASRRRDETSTQVAAAQPVLDQAQAELAQAEQLTATIDGAALANRRQAALARQQRLQALQQLLDRIAADMAREASLRGERDDTAGQLAALAELLRQAETALPALAAQQAEARRAYEQTLAAGHLDQQRSLLVDGEPCPLCGAEQHPWAVHTPFAPLLASLQTRADELAGGLAAAQAEARSLGARHEILSAQLGRLERELTPLAASLAELHGSSRNEAGELGLAGLFLTDELDLALAAQASVLADIDSREAAGRAAQAAVATRRQQLDAARAALDTSKLGLQQAQEALAVLQQQFAQWQLKAESAQRLCDEATAELAVPFADWPEMRLRLATAADAVLAEAEQALATRRADEARLAGVQAILVELSARLQLADRDCTHATQQQTAASVQLQACATARDAHLARRSGLLGGAPVAEFEGCLKHALMLAEQGHEAARAAASQAEAELAATGAALAEAAQRLSQAEQERHASADALAAQLTPLGIDLDTLRQRLAHGPAWVAAERQSLQSLADALTQAEAVGREREAALDEHRQACPSALPEDELQAQHGELRAQWLASQDEAARLRELLRQDEARRSRMQARQAQLAELQGTAAVWRQMREMIGSADGRKFRVYAQSLTLEVLLAHANHHLAELARRYRLERAPGADMEIQVIDTDMGDEVRTVHSLSGGESFLVSLALALALASLSSKRTQVESLFIDEGFGSLDADTLAVAMDALDNLQAGGRQIGVISHVAALHERIPAQVRVEAKGGGRSSVSVQG
ncbi:AAA family ATPase [Chitinivorax sp. PXF-14]|uniref:AAA family ATPase n=1 Tax=Chitinivorax sp. PXF-14 TaxID=3230488 RepID=UPI0034665FE4